MIEKIINAFNDADEMIMISDDAVEPQNIEVLYVNQAFTEVTGYTTDEIDNLAILYSSEVSPDMMKDFKTSRVEKKGFEGYILEQNKSGEYIWIHLSLIPLFDTESQNWYFLHKPTLVDEHELLKTRKNLLQETDPTGNLINLALWEWYPSDITFFSENMYNLLGIDQKQRVASMDIYKEAITDEYDPSIIGNVEELAKDGVEKIPLHAIRQLESGDIRYVRGCAERVTINQKLWKIQGIMKDVSQYEKQLQQTQLFKKAMESSNSGITISDYSRKDNPLIYINRGFEKMTGYSKENVLGTNCRFLQGNDRQQDERFKLRKAIENKEPVKVELKNYTKDGQRFWNRLRVAPIKNRQGKVTHFVGVQHDITAEVELNNQLKESERMWRSLVQVNPELITLIKDGVITYINKAGANIYGADEPDDVEGMPASEMVNENEKVALQERLRNLEKGEDTGFYTYQINSFDDTARYVRARSVPIQISDESAILTVGQDITKEYHNKAMLRKLHEQKQTLLKEIHHRVKNNMAIISGLLDLQKEDIENPNAVEALSNSQLRLQTMAKVHEQLYQQKDLTDIQTDEYIGELINTIQDTHGSEQIKMVQEIEAFQMNVNQAIPLGLILNELIINAYKHAFKKDKGTIWLRLAVEDDAITAQVRDNGQGFPKNFDYEEPETLGFNIVQTLVGQLRAGLNINSDNEGTAIELTFNREQLSGSGSNIQEFDE